MGRERAECGVGALVVRLALVPSPAARSVLVLAGVAGVAALLSLHAVASLAGVASLALPLLTLARRSFDDGSAVTPVLAAVALFWFGALGAIEALSLASLLGSRPAWTLLCVATACALQAAVDGRRGAPLRRDILGLRPLSRALREPWTVIVGPMALVLGSLYAQSAYLDLFTGINHADGQAYYMARSIRYLQDGNLATYSTVNDFLPPFHQAVSAYLLLFYGAESAILLLSWLFGGLVGLALFDLSRLMRPPVSLSVLAGLSPLSVTIFSLHLGTANFDIHVALFLLLVIYFLALSLLTSRPRYLALAACAVALALATKPTFWFAAAGLAVFWLAALAALARRRGPGVAARWALIAALIVSLGGLHVVRNAWYLGFPLAPDLPEYGRSAPATPRGRLEAATFHVLASSTALLTPRILVGDDAREAITRRFRQVNEGLGIRLPDPQIFFYPERSWDDVFDHLRMPFHSDKAGFGAVVPLVVAPAALFVVADGLGRRAAPAIARYVVLFAVLYLATMGLALKYAADHVRYQIEMVVPLLVLVPVLIARLPLAAGLLYLAVAGGFMLADASQAYARNQARPPDGVLTVPRDLQYATFVAPDRMAYFTGARVLDEKYPVDWWPELFLLKEDLGRGQYFEYPFLDVLGRRRVTPWAADLRRPRPDWPGPLLVTDPASAEILRDRFAEQVALDRLSDLVWVALPLDRLRVTWRVVPADRATPSVVQLEARVSAERYARPHFRFSAARAPAGEPHAVLREFSDAPAFSLPRSGLSPDLDLLVEVREAGRQEAAERTRVPQATLLGP
jgi:hypothetical protein